VGRKGMILTFFRDRASLGRRSGGPARALQVRELPSFSRKFVSFWVKNGWVERNVHMAFMDKHKKRWINSELSIALAFNLAAWFVVAVLAFTVMD
jgi:hypothetical protein